MNERRRVAAFGIAAVVVYAMLAAASGRMSPLARRPLLDTTRALPYRWVNPPPELASTNIVPKSSGFSLLVRNGGVPADTLPGSDGQLIVIVPQDFTTPPAGTATIDVKFTPLDPATLGPPGNGLVVLGNVYRIQATFQPSGTIVGSIDSPLEVILTYPTHVGPPLQRTVIASTDGKTWTTVSSKESPVLHQIEGPVSHFGYAAVAGPPGGASAGTGRSIWLIAAAALVAVMLVAAGVGLALRRRRTA